MRSARPVRSRRPPWCCRSQHRLIPPTANTKVIEDDMQIDVVIGEGRPWEPGPSLSNNFGFGGHNGCDHHRPRCLTPARVSDTKRPRHSPVSGTPLCDEFKSYNTGCQTPRR